jgi:large subunit ribosomal protein L29
VKKKTKELRPLDAESLAKALAETQKALFDLRFRATTEKVESVAKMRELRKDIARIKTLQSEREKGIVRS